MAAGNLVEFTDSNFNAEVLSAATPVVVDFWAEWCAPCKMLTPTMVKVADKYVGKVKVGKMNIDQNQEGAKHGIQSIPTLLLFKGGKEVGKLVGLRSEAEVSAWIDKASA